MIDKRQIVYKEIVIRFIINFLISKNRDQKIFKYNCKVLIKNNNLVELLLKKEGKEMYFLIFKIIRVY